MHSSRHEYRPDIDGLRALAVLAVVVFHANPAMLPGGFAGVDVFFVISGYLITGIVLRETRAHTFTFQNFYARRCRRILPALMVVLAATWALGRATLVGDDIRFLGKHILGGATFTSNLLLWREAGYFDINSIRKPLLHLWSLGVEEQFYLVWPPLIALTTWLKWRSTIVSSVVLLASLGLAVALSGKYDEATFYLLPTRMWELLAGALLVQTEASRERDRPTVGRTSWVHELTGLLGVTLIVIACLYDAGTGQIRVAWLMLPIAGTVFAIGAKGSVVNRHLLARRPLVIVGLMSYPLYLWHWPLLSIVMLIGERMSMTRLRLLEVGTVAAAFALAWLTWQFVETPIRHWASPREAPRRRNTRVLSVSAVALVIAALVGLQTWDRHNVIGNRIVPDVAAANDPVLDWSAIFPNSGYHRISASEPVAWLVGDSHADHLMPGLIEEARDRGAGVSHVGFAGCLGIPLSARVWGPPRNFAACQALSEDTFKYFLASRAVRTVVFAARYSVYVTGYNDLTKITVNDLLTMPLDQHLRVLEDGYGRAMRRAFDAGKRVVLVRDVPELDFDPQYCANDMTGRCAVDRAAGEKRQQGFDGVIARLKSEFPDLVVFDPTPLFCDARWCYAQRNGLMMFRDRTHLTRDGSRLIARGLAPLLFEQNRNRRATTATAPAAATR